MDFSVNYEKLQEIGEYIATKAEEIDTTLGEMKNITKEIKEAWNGVDSNIFINKMEKRIENTKLNNEKIKKMSAIIGTINNNYKDKDLEWHNKIKNEGFYNEYRV